MSQPNIEIVDLGAESLPAYCHCLEEWSEEMREAGTIKCEWVEDMRDRGLGVRLALHGEDEYVGMIQYLPAELTAVDGPGHYHIHCCWVHSFKNKGVGDWRGKGIGQALLRAAEEDIRSRGGIGVTAWGLTIPVCPVPDMYRARKDRRTSLG